MPSANPSDDASERGDRMPESVSRRIVVIGGGPAGVFAAIEAKR